MIFKSLREDDVKNFRLFQEFRYTIPQQLKMKQSLILTHFSHTLLVALNISLRIS